MPAERPELDAFETGYAEALAAITSVGERIASQYASLPPGAGEKLVRCMWFDELFDPETLRLEDGRPLRVVSPGFWNEGAGPDFLHAEISLDNGPVVKGAVEIHTLASHWFRHNHGGDPSYDSVILHVVFTNDLDTPHLHTVGRSVPQLALERRLTCDLRETLEALDLEFPLPGARDNAGPCRGALERRGEWFPRFLDMAGDARALDRAERYAADLETSTPDQTLYEGVMDALGYKGNRRPFRRLARLAPIAELRQIIPLDADPEERSGAAQAVLFGVAGLLPTEGEAAALDAPSQEYVRALRDGWQRVAGRFGHRCLERSAWKFGFTRPANYPTRRIAAAAAFLSQRLGTGLYRAIVDAFESAAALTRPDRRSRAAVRNLRDLFVLADPGYWSSRCVFGGKPLPRPTRLIGEQRAATMMVNVVAPVALACARRERDSRLESLLHGVYATMKREAENSVTRFMDARLFRDPERARSVVDSARRQQGLIQLYHDFCESDAAPCERCAFLALAIEQEKAAC